MVVLDSMVRGGLGSPDRRSPSTGECKKNPPSPVDSGRTDRDMRAAKWTKARGIKNAVQALPPQQPGSFSDRPIGQRVAAICLRRSACRIRPQGGSWLVTTA